MELFNIRIDCLGEDVVKAVFHSQEYKKAKKVKATLIHWIPENTGVKCQVVLPDATVADGLAEENSKKLNVDTLAQFERFGFVRIDSGKDSLITAYYCHR